MPSLAGGWVLPVSRLARHCDAGAPPLTALLMAVQYQRMLHILFEGRDGQGGHRPPLSDRNAVCVFSSAITSFSYSWRPLGRCRDPVTALAM